MSTPVPVFVDTDGGLDDALALLYAARCPQLRLQAVGTVHGNVAPTAAARVALRILELCGDENTPVAIGAQAPLARQVHYRHPDDPAGTMLGPSTRAPAAISAAEQLIACARAAPGRLAVLALGPLTNLATALRLEPSLPSLLGQVVAMGGLFRGHGNITARAESNFYHDPEAAEQVCTAGFDLTLLGLEITRQVTPSTAWLAALGRDEPHPWAGYARILADLDPPQRPNLPLHDPLAAVALAEPSVIVTRPRRVSVDTSDGDNRGRTRAEASPEGTCHVADTVDAYDALARLAAGLRLSQSR